MKQKAKSFREQRIDAANELIKAVQHPEQNKRIETPTKREAIRKRTEFNKLVPVTQ